MRTAMIVGLCLAASAAVAQERAIMDFESDGVGQQPKGFEFDGDSSGAGTGRWPAASGTNSGSRQEAITSPSRSTA
jgi:hypothetical protein